MAILMMGNTYYNGPVSVRYQASMPPHTGNSFSSPVIKRILRILLENGELKKSNLCSKAGLNYTVCTRYLNFLSKLRWVQISQAGDQSARISVANEGIQNLRKLESDSGEKQEDIHEDANQRTSSPAGLVNSHADGQAKNMKGRESTVDTKKKIVIIDDDENVLSTYSAFLETDKTLQVQTFSSSKKALEYLTLHPDSSDLILLDIRMPGMSGLRLYQAVKAVSPKTTIIFLSSLDAAPELSELFSDPKLGNRNFLRKPVSRANFIETVKRAVA